MLGPAPRDAATVVMLHEGLGCVAMWQDFPKRLAKATGLGVFVYSRAGYGGSSPCPLPRPLSYMHDEALTVLPQLLDAIELHDGVLLGHSDGASIATIYSGGVRDLRIRALVLFAPHFFTEDRGIASIQRAKEVYAQTDLRERLTLYHGDNVDCAFHGWNSAWLDPEFRRWDLREYLGGIEIPLLIVQGEDDEYGTPLQLDAAVEGCAGLVDTRLLPGCGHSPHRDRPDVSLELVCGFLARAGMAMDK